MVFVYGLLFLGVALVTWRFFSPADMRLNRRFLAKYLKDSYGRLPSQLKIEKLPVTTQPGQPEEKAYFAISATYPDHTVRDALVQIFYPLEAMFAERQKRRQQAESEGGSVMETMPRQDHDQSVPPQARRLVGDPLQDLKEEEKIKAQKSARQVLEIKQLIAMNSCTTFFPKLLAHDAKEDITLISPVGTRRLDHVLATSDASQKDTLLQNLLTDLALWHARADVLTDQLFPAGSLTPALMRSQLAVFFADYAPATTLSVLVSDLEVFAQTAESVCHMPGATYGPKMAEASPRAFFVDGGSVAHARPFDFGRVRQDYSLLDVVELLCDPATALSLPAERALMEHYLAMRSTAQENFDMEGQRKILLGLAIYYRLLLQGFLCGKGDEVRRAFSVPYWTEEAIPTNVRALWSYWRELQNELVVVEVL